MKLFHTRLTILALSALVGLAANAAELATTQPVAAKTNGEKWWRGNCERIMADIKKLEGEIDVAFVGDSITARWKGDSWNKHWGAYRAVNMGIGGDRTQNVLWRLQNGQLDGYQARLFVLMIGTNNNDPAADVAEGVKAIIELIKSRQPQAKILLLGIFPRGEEPNAPARAKNDRMNDLISKFGDGVVHYLDISAKFLEPDGTISKQVMPDSLHLGAKGYDIWAEAIHEKVKELLGGAKSGQKTPAQQVVKFEKSQGTSFKNPPNRGQRVEVKYDKLKQDFMSPDMIYAPFIFWFWDEPLDPAKMAEMSRVMGSQGFNPGYAHGRNNMVGQKSLPDDEWLGDKWFSAFDAALKEAEKQKHYLGYCDEYWWPSFQAHGRVLQKHPELRAVSLSWQIIDAAGGTEVNVPTNYFAVAARLDNPGTPGTNDTATIYSKTLQVIGSGDAFSWKAPQDGAWRVYAFNQYNRSGIDGGAVNSIDDRLARAFIDIALEPYAKRLGDKLGKSIPGDFIDHEGDYGRQLAWSGTLDSRFREKYGRDIRLTIPLMVNRDAEGLYAKARWEWFDTVSDLYAANFREITDWHEKRGMYTTAHLWEESITLQTHAVGDHMKMLRALTMPGQDCLGKKAVFVRDFKEIASVAEFQNSRAATELMGAGSFGTAGNGAGKEKEWNNFTPVFLKQAVNAVTAWGMSHIIPHGVFTSRKLSGNPWPPDWYSENPMFPCLHLWTDFTRRASYINSMGTAVPDVLLYNPLESAWINVRADLLDVKVWDILEGRVDDNRYHAINKVYADAINDLTDARVEFLVGDRFYLKQMELKDGRLVRGDFAFSAVVLPLLEILTLDAAAKIVDFAKAGGKVFSLGDLPGASAENGLNDPKMKALMDTLKVLPTFSTFKDGLKTALAGDPPGLQSPVKFASGGFKMLQHRRRIDGKDFFWLVNNAEQKQDCEIVVPGVKGEAAIWDCESGRVRVVSSENVAGCSRLKLSFKPLEAYWLVFDPGSRAKIVPVAPEAKEVMTVTGAWKVSYAQAIQPVIEFPANPPVEFKAGVEKPLEDWKAWGPGKFSGLMDYTKTINVDKAGKQMFLDLGKVCHAAEVWVNGKSVGQKLWGPYVFDVSKAIRSGPNKIHVRVANLINNSYCDIQESGLFGPVVVMGDDTAKR